MGHNSVKNFRKLTHNNTNFDLRVPIHIHHLVKLFRFDLKLISGNKILASIKDHNYVPNLRKMAGSNPNLDLVNIIAHTFVQIQSIFSNERKQNSDINQGQSCNSVDAQQSQPRSCQYQCIYT